MTEPRSRPTTSDVDPRSFTERARIAWPPLPLRAWQDTRDTIHRWAQVVGKLQLAWSPMANHWWNVALEVTPRGVGSGVLACGDRWFDLELDFINDLLRIRISDGTEEAVPLRARPVAEFYAEVVATLARVNIACPISPVPTEVDDLVPFDQDLHHRAYDKPYVLAFWQIAARVAGIMRQFRGGFVGKSSPVQLYWGHLDLALTRFSGRPAPPYGNRIERESSSHEQFAVGWWPGDSRLEKPAFYAYAWPEPAGFPTAPITTPHAYYHPGLHGFYLDYDDARAAPDPDALIRDFFEQTYAAAADLGQWDRAALERHG